MGDVKDKLTEHLSRPQAKPGAVIQRSIALKMLTMLFLTQTKPANVGCGSSLLVLASKAEEAIDQSHDHEAKCR